MQRIANYRTAGLLVLVGLLVMFGFAGLSNVVADSVVLLQVTNLIGIVGMVVAAAGLLIGLAVAIRDLSQPLRG